MNPLIHKARSLRLQSQALSAEADYYAARGDGRNAEFYKSLATDYADMADETDARATKEAA